MVEEMKIRDGYKKTEVGVIPEDWEVVNLIEISNLIGDGIHTTPKYVSNSETYFINGNNLINGKIKIFKETKCINKIEYEKHKKNLNNNTILMSINGTIGNLAFYNNEKIILGKSASYININKGANKKYIFYQLQMESINKFYENKLTGTTIRNLSLKTIRETPILFPPLKEQKAIATALSDMDDLIESTQKLIDKKKKIKQGTMQELLTGKKRLDGFSGEWEVKKLGEVANIQKGKQLNKSKLSEKDENPVMNGGIDPSGYTNKWNTSENTIIISEGGNSCGYVNYIKSKFWSGGHCYNLNLRYVNIDDIFLYQLLKYNQNELMNLRVGSGLPNIQKKSINNYEIEFPPLKEQKAIAQILSDMDSEIELLEEKLQKYKTIKKGMMQELLTGRIRLI